MRPIGISRVILILLLSLSSSTLCQAQEKPDRPIKRIEGRAVSRHGLLILITPESEAYVLKKGPKSDKHFNRVKELANQDTDIMLNGSGTKELSLFEQISYKEGKMISVWRAKYKVFEVRSVKKVKSPSKVSYPDIEKALNLASVKEEAATPSLAAGAPAELPPRLEKAPLIPPVVAGPKDLTSRLEKAPAISPGEPKSKSLATDVHKLSPIREPYIPRLPAQPPILAEIEGKVIFIDRERSPMLIKVQSLQDTNEIVSIFVPRGTGIINKSGTANVDAIKVGDQVDIWYRELPGQNKADMVTIVD